MAQQFAASPPEDAQPVLTERRLRALIFLVAGAMFMENLDGTIIVTALPTMAKTFGHTAIALNIGVSAYLLALGIFIPASGWVAERFGTRRLFAIAIALFMAASALCGIANRLPFFVAMRVFQGVAGAMMVPVGRVVILRSTPGDKLMAAMGSLIWPALMAPVLGPPLGGFITTHASWRWIFYLNIPLGVVALLVTLRILPDFRSTERPPFDSRGFVLCGGGICALLSGLERMVQHLDAVTLALLIAGSLLVVLAWRHFRRAQAPMIDLRATSIPTFRIAMRGGSAYRLAIASGPFLLPLMFQVGFGFSPEKSGLLMLGMFGADFALKSVTNRIIRAFGFRRVLVVNGLLCAVALGSFSLLRATTPLPLIVLVLALGGATRSMQFTTISMITFADIPKPMVSGVSVLSSTVVQLGMGAGIALGATGVRIGQGIAGQAGIAAPDTPFHIAFLLTAALAFAGLMDALQLAPDAGDRFASREKPAG